jgi:hypothetical protein
MRPFQGSLRTIILSAAVELAAASTPLLSQKVSTDYDHGANFSQYHSYSFGKIQASDPLFEQRIRDEVSRDLNARGWQMVPSGGDVTVNAIGGVKSKQEYSTFYDGLGPGFGWRHGWGGGGFGDTYTTVDQIPVGTLVVDLYSCVCGLVSPRRP